MTTQTETATLENNIPMEENNQEINANFSSTGGIDANLGTTGIATEGSIPMGEGMAFESGNQGGLVMGVGGGVGDNAPDVTFSTRNMDGTAFGTTKTTTTTTTTQYGFGQSQGEGSALLMGMGDNANMVGQTTTTTSTERTPYEMGLNLAHNVQSGGAGLVMSVGGGAEDDAVDVTYSSNTGNNLGAAAAKTTTTTTTTTTQYGLGQAQGGIIEGDGAGLVMGVGGGIEDNAVDVTYSTKTDQGIGLGGAKTTTTTTTTKTEYGLGQGEGQIIQGDGAGLVMGVGGGIEDNAVDVTYSTKTNEGVGLGTAQTTTTTTTTETQYGTGMGIATGVRKSVDISKYATTQTINEGIDIKSLEIYKKTTLLILALNCFYLFQQEI